MSGPQTRNTATSPSPTLFRGTGAASYSSMSAMPGATKPGAREARSSTDQVVSGRAGTDPGPEPAALDDEPGGDRTPERGEERQAAQQIAPLEHAARERM